MSIHHHIHHQCCYQDQTFQDQDQDQDRDLASSNKVNATTERWRYQYHHNKLISGDIKMHNKLVKYSAWSTAQDLQCPCSHSLVQNEYTIYKVESFATSTAQLVQCPMSMQSHSSSPSACCTSRTQLINELASQLCVLHDSSLQQSHSEQQRLLWPYVLSIFNLR